MSDYHNTRNDAKRKILIAMMLLSSSYMFAQFPAPSKGAVQFQNMPHKSRPNYSIFEEDTVMSMNLLYPRVARRFATLFPDATDQVWIRETGVLYVSFSHRRKKTSAVFTPEGKMNYSIAHLAVSDLPSDIVQKIRSIYPADSIFSIKEVTVDSANLFEIILQNIQQFTVLSIFQGELREVKKVVKS